MNENSYILIADDQPVVADTLGVYLKNAGFEYKAAYDGEETMALFNEEEPALILLDIMMPKKNGIDVCREIRQVSNVPIIILSAKDEDVDRIVGLELGADDYVVKSTASNREIVARIKAVLRRVRKAKEQPTNTIKFRDLEINASNYEVRVQGKLIRFTSKEVEILYLLASHPSQVISRQEILAKVWGTENERDERVVDTQIKRIRQKFPEGKYSWDIRTIYGKGYKFETRE